jgi:ribose-phosphate pyrophosphokinase
MKILNLINKDASDIKYQVYPFPDGQQQIVINSTVIESSAGEEWATDINIHKILIKSRLNDFKDLELIVCVTKSLRKLGVKEIHLYTPYFLGSRSDRQFEEGSCNYLKDVICPIINSLEFESVTVLDPHSDVLEACLNNFKKISNYNLISFALDNLYPKSYSQKEYILVSPDAGASKKIYKLAEQIGYKGDIITCSKDRNENGKLTKTVVPIPEHYDNQDLIIIDDICDGGTTFINISKELEELRNSNIWENPPKLYLIVTHGIFSKGFEELSKYFDGIYCTNSYKDIKKYWEYTSTTGPTTIKQLNVF